jgi:hypothetical protein
MRLDVHNFHFSQNTIIMIKLRNMRCVSHVTRMEAKRNTYSLTAKARRNETTTKTYI